MTNPDFLVCDAMCRYKALVVPIATFLLSILARYESMENNKYRWLLVVAWLALVSLTITHHMTDYVFVGFLALWTVVSLVARTRARASWTSPRPYPAMGEAAPRMRGILTAFAFS